METSIELIKRPSAWLPMGMSVAILALLISVLATVGAVQQADEGAAAHLFQFWLVLESSMIVFFGFKWVPEVPREAQWIMAAQIVLALIPISIVFYLGL